VARGELPDGLGVGASVGFVLTLWILTLAVGLWPVAASAWAPRGSLATPLAAFVLAVVAWPCWLLGSSWWYRPSLTEIVLLGLGLLVAGLVSARVGFVHGRALHRTRLSAAGRALGAAALISSPSWAWGAHKAWEFYRVDPYGSGFSILDAALGDGGRYAFVTAYHCGLGWKDQPMHALQVDLQSGEWKELGGPGTYIETVPSVDDDSLASWPDVASEQRVLDFDSRQLRLRLDGEGREIRSEVHQPVSTWHSPAGLGYRDGYGASARIWDPYRRRTFRWREVVPEACWQDDTEVLVSRPGWLLASARKPYWRTLDPESHAVVELDWPWQRHQRAPVLADGRLFLLRGEELLLADPADGSLAVVDLPEDASRSLAFVANAFGCWDPLRSDRPILLNSGLGILCIDVEALRATRRFESGLFTLGLLPDGDLLASDRSRLLAVDAASGERRVLFPRPAP